MTLTESMGNIKAQIDQQNADFLKIMQSANFTSIEDVKRMFGTNYFGPEKICELYDKTPKVVNGVQMNPMTLEAFAKAGHIIMYQPEVSVKEILEKTASKKQADGVVMYYPDQFNADGSINKPWFKDVNGFDFSPYILSMANTKARFIIVKPEEIANTPSKRVSAQLQIQKEYHRDILGDAMPVDFKITSDALTSNVINCLKRLEDKDWQSATGTTLSLPFVEKCWPTFDTDMYVYATLSSIGFGEKFVMRRGMYNRVRTASPFGAILLFGRSEDGAYVSSCRASSASSDVGLYSSCILDIA